MSYSNQTINNKSFIKRFSHKGRFDVALSLLNVNSNDCILDFGTGDGYLLQLIANNKSVKEIVGYEPVPEMFKELETNINSIATNNISVINSLDDILHKKFNYVICLEVLEHFSKKLQIEHIEAIKKLTDYTSIIIISVPLEIGLNALFKNIIRILVGQKQSNTSFKSVTKAVLGYKDNRQQSGYINSHVGFNHKTLEELFKKNNLKIIKKHYSPFKYLFGILNSQIFYVLKRV